MNLSDVKKIKDLEKDEITDVVKFGAGIADLIFKPLFSLYPKFILDLMKKITPYHFFLACIGKFSSGLLLGAHFPKLVKKHRIKIFIISILSALPVIYEVFLKDE